MKPTKHNLHGVKHCIPRKISNEGQKNILPFHEMLPWDHICKTSTIVFAQKPPLKAIGV
jgi:hypothetical protein